MDKKHRILVEKYVNVNNNVYIYKYAHYHC